VRSLALVADRWRMGLHGDLYDMDATTGKKKELPPNKLGPRANATTTTFQAHCPRAHTTTLRASNNKGNYYTRRTYKHCTPHQLLAAGVCHVPRRYVQSQRIRYVILPLCIHTWTRLYVSVVCGPVCSCGGYSVRRPARVPPMAMGRRGSGGVFGLATSTAQSSCPSSLC
jgi:hypothetical protein